MAGFCLEIRAITAPEPAPPRPVDLGNSGSAQTFRYGLARVAASYRKESRQWWTREHADGMLLIEGQPDRYPAEGESLGDWLAGGRWGSYRGLEVRAAREPSTAPQATVFSDPLGTRPMYVHRGNGHLLVSDKLATLALNAKRGLEPHWPAVLEAMTLGSLYTHDTTLRGVDELEPGEVREYHGAEELRRMRFGQPPDDGVDRQQVRRDPASTLLDAMKKAVTETWADPQTWLLLSGGLDSRLVLALAGPGRKAVTLALYEKETEIARQLAACCRAELRVFPHLAADFLQSTQLALPTGGAMHDLHFFNHLGLGAKWRSEGVTAVAHAYLFDTLLKGYFLLPAGGYPRTLLAHMMPQTAKFFERISGRASPFAADDVIRLLSPRGKELLRERLSALDASIDREAEGDLDLTFENRVLKRISRQIHYGTFLGWCEELDVSSPIFHPALWSWHAHSRAHDRLNGRAFVRALLSVDHEACRVVDSNTGAAPRVPAPPRSDFVRHSRLYQRFLQPVWKSLVRPNEDVHFPSGLGVRYREPDAIQFMTESIAEVSSHELFDREAIESHLARFTNGEDRYLEPLLSCVSAGRWRKMVADRSAGPSASQNA